MIDLRETLSIGPSPSLAWGLPTPKGNTNPSKPENHWQALGVNGSSPPTPSPPPVKVGDGIKLIKGANSAPKLLTPQDHPQLSWVTFPYFCADRKLLQRLITKEMRDHLRTPLLIHLENVCRALVPSRPETNMQRSCLTFALE